MLHEISSVCHDFKQIFITLYMCSYLHRSVFHPKTDIETEPNNLHSLQRMRIYNWGNEPNYMKAYSREMNAKHCSSLLLCNEMSCGMADAAATCKH